jgi:oxygen-dependent protoporphyrinogen oxidase
VVTALVSSLPPSNLISDVAVSNVEWRGTWRIHLSTGRHIDAPAVLLATPPQTIADLVQHLDPALSGLLGRVRDVGLITVALGYRRADVRNPLAGSGFVVTKRDGASVNAVTWMSSKWMERALADGVLLRASVGGARNPHATSWSNADILARVRNDVRRYLHITAQPVFARVYRMPHAGVQLDVGHLPLIERVQGRLRALPGAFISAAGVRGVGIADCVGDARAQAMAVAEYVRCKETQHASAVSG